jgi:hypothetical protein
MIGFQTEPALASPTTEGATHGSTDEPSTTSVHCAAGFSGRWLADRGLLVTVVAVPVW